MNLQNLSQSALIEIIKAQKTALKKKEMIIETQQEDLRIVVHDIKGILAGPISALSLLDADDAETVQLRNSIVETACQEASDYASKILELGRDHIDTFHLAKIAKEVAENDPKIRVQIPEEMSIRSCPFHFESIIRNFIVNSKTANRSAHITLSASQKSKEIEVVLQDDAGGVPEEKIQNFQKLKATGIKGNGLGHMRDAAFRMGATPQLGHYKEDGKVIGTQLCLTLPAQAS